MAHSKRLKEEAICSDWGTWKCQEEVAVEEVDLLEREAEEDHVVLRVQNEQ